MNIYKIVFEGIFRNQTLFYTSQRIPTYDDAYKFIKAYGFPDAKIYKIEKLH